MFIRTPFNEIISTIKRITLFKHYIAPREMCCLYAFPSKRFKQLCAFAKFEMFYLKIFSSFEFQTKTI